MVAAGGRVLDENAAIGAALSGPAHRTSRAGGHPGRPGRGGPQRAHRPGPGLAVVVRQTPIGGGRSTGTAVTAPAARRRRRAAAAEPLAARQWDMAMINATPSGSQAVEPGRPEVLVGVVDTGIDASHPDLAPNFDAALSRNFTEDIPLVDGPCEDRARPVLHRPRRRRRGWHGTHVAGTIAAAANGVGIAGVAPGVRLVNLRAGQDSGCSSSSRPSMRSPTPPTTASTWSTSASTPTPGCSTAGPTRPTAREQLQQARSWPPCRPWSTTPATVGYASWPPWATRPSISTTRPSTPPAPTSRPGPPASRAVDNSCPTVPAELDRRDRRVGVGPSGRKATYSNYGAAQADLSAPGGSYGDLPVSRPRPRRRGPDPVALSGGRLAAGTASSTRRVSRSAPTWSRTVRAGPAPTGATSRARRWPRPMSPGWRRWWSSSVSGPTTPTLAGLTRPPSRARVGALGRTARDWPCDTEGPGGSCVGDASRNSHYGEGLVDVLAAGPRPETRGRPGAAGDDLEPVVALRALGVGARPPSPPRSRRRHPTSWVSRRSGWRRTAPTRPRAGRPARHHCAVGELRFHDGLAFTNALLSRWPIDAVESHGCPGPTAPPRTARRFSPPSTPPSVGWPCSPPISTGRSTPRPTGRPQTRAGRVGGRAPQPADVRLPGRAHRRPQRPARRR